MTQREQLSDVENELSLIEVKLGATKPLEELLAQRDAIRPFVKIDELSLDEEVLLLPQIVEDLGELYSVASYKVALLKSKLECVKSLIAAGLRAEDAKISESKISSITPGDEIFLAAQTQFIQAVAVEDKIRRTYDAFRTKHEALKTAASLFIAGYFTRETITGDRRRELNTARTAEKE